MPSAETSNKAFIDAAAQVIQILAGVVTLQDSNPEHLRLAMQVGDILSHVFETHGISATVVPPVLLSAAMEMLEHLDRTWQSFSASIERQGPHPLCIQAGAINIHRRGHKVDASTGPIKAKAQAGIEEEAGEGDSSSSRPPALPGDRESSYENSAPPPATTSKKQKVAKVPLPSPAIGLQEDSGATMDAPELVPRCDQCIKLSFICRQGYGATSAGLKACAQCSRLKLKCSRSKIETAPVPKGKPSWPRLNSRRHPPTEDILMEGDAAAPHAPIYSVLPIATLLPDSRSSDPAKSSSPPTLDPPRESVVPSLQHSMEVDSEGDAMVNDLRAMTMPPMVPGLNLSNCKLSRPATADLLNVLNNRLAAQDADIHALQDVRANMNALNDWLAAQDADILCTARCSGAIGPSKNKPPLSFRTPTTLFTIVYSVKTSHYLPPFSGPIYHANPQYSGNHSMMPVSMGQMQAMEGLYFNLPAGASTMGGPSVGNVAGGSGWNGAGGLSASRSHNQITGSSRTGAHAFGESALGRGPQN
ncbi:uncharacterized protein EDB91DRAFT_1256022 [Suillus paluster]|uniref:uncharacterized protein n=1 Tax=Suillus paluster TaxID=48578 RepID=UPI001B85D300|nr:uncharacterized protein EDB91DRAFT_1256022 [Suillus paluster]KAG1722551.1 hypothetical protein EDB91DRAFT_1256022 [Suillus paluster]